MLKRALILGWACWPAVAVSQSAQLGDAEIRQLVSGATIALDTPLGSKIPIRYTPDGRVIGEARDLASYLGAERDTGLWWVGSGELCHQWTRWFEQKVQCLKLSRHGRAIEWRNQEGRTGTASVMVPAPVQTAAAAPANSPSATPRTMPEGAMRLSAPQSLPLKASGSVEPAAPVVANAATAVNARRPPQAATSSVPSAPVSTAAASPALSSMQPRRPLEQQSASATFVVANVERGDVLNVRAGPSAEHEVVSSLEPGIGGITISGTCRVIWCPITRAATHGWVNRRFLEEHAGGRTGSDLPRDASVSTRDLSGVARDSPQAPRGCLTPAARALLDRIEGKFGPVRLVSTCRQGATIAGSGRPSRHASGNAIDFDAGSRKAAIVDWLIANHRDGGTMTYPGMDHIHADIGPHFVSIAGGRRWASWRDGR